MIRPTIINDGNIIVRDRTEIRAVFIAQSQFGDQFPVLMICAGVPIQIAVFKSRDEAKAYVADVCKQAGIEMRSRTLQRN